MATEEVAVEGGDVDRRDVSASTEEVSVEGGGVDRHDVFVSRLTPTARGPTARPNAISVEIVDVDRYEASGPRLASIAAGGSTKSNAISVEQYTEDRDLHEAIAASLLQTGSQSLDKDDDVRVLDSFPAGTRSSSSRKRKKTYSCSSVTEAGQTSNSKPVPSFICEICVEPLAKSDLFRIKGCSHAYCNDCVAKYVASKLQDNVTRIGCPVSGCGGVLEPGYCSSILPPEVFDRWGNALCEALILEAEKFYCPFKDCSALLIKDGGAAVVRESECPNCRRLFCAQCRVPWHAGLECQEFQGLNEGEKGREDIMIQLAPSSSLRKPKCKTKPYSVSLATETDQPLNSEKGREDIMIRLAPSLSSQKPKRKKKPYSGSLVTEIDQPLNSKPDASIICEICIEPRTNSDLFHIKGCNHTYCVDCVTKYVASKLQDNVTHIDCPVSGCGGLLEPEYCRSILSPELFDRWGNALCEALILEGERFYCPFKDCSALLINDGGVVVRESECPNCRRLFCAECRVPWHAGVECQEFQEMKEGERGREDIMLMKLAEKKHWRRCPKCRFFVQKISGCAFVKCRCGVEFCYRCGAPSKTSHYCTKCLR
ncbi:uncharacterized protein LOC115746698 isoform X2 [Rhodamnia argentea]|uniref:RBR-type E3 ubiquitin transferase n=1 Tax=Rhodamnia argentea TaxID=178133 RepID=A0ABM3H9C1_9MYRT|nr:uncharacterized protein LOC115746698 isoform X2 [Rhodamnia argentea]